MYSILIVDDEELICKGLKSMIERNCRKYIDSISYTTMPLGIVGFINEFNPDIIITDIRMPDMSGLELIRLVNETYPHIKFIALSGYDDFKYVKEAFNLGVVDYLLKPASVEELNAVIEKVASELEDEKRRDIAQKNDNLKLKHAVIENTLNKLFAGINIEEESLHKFYNEAQSYFPYSQFLISIIYRGNSAEKSGDNAWIAGYNEKYSEVFSQIKGVCSFNLLTLNNDLILIINMDWADKYKLVVEQLEHFLKDQRDRLGFELFASLSSLGTGIQNIQKCYKQAREAIAYRILLESGKIILYNDISVFKKEAVFEKQLLKIRDGIVNANKVGISSIIDELFSNAYLKNCTIESIHKMFANVIRVLEDAAAANGISPIPGHDEDFGLFNSLSDVRIHVKTVIFDVITKLAEGRKSKSAVDMVKEYVHQNLHRDIDLAVAANLASVSYAHFSKLFKDETGMNFSDYLTKARMEKALELLGSPVNKVQDISVKVGYSNPKHFTRAFKNYFGFSPTEYRNA